MSTPGQGPPPDAPTGTTPDPPVTAPDATAGAGTVRFSVTHRTTYRYDAPVSLGYSEARLRPRVTNYQRCERSSVSIAPAVDDRTDWRDFFGNAVTYFSIERPHTELEVVATSLVDVDVDADPGPGPAWEDARDRVAAAAEPETIDAWQYTIPSPLVGALEEVADYAAPSFPPGRPLVEATLDLVTRIHTDFEYDPTATDLATPLDEVMHLRRGVCQDFAHVGIAALRSLHLPARYVSGYLETDPPPGRERLMGVDQSHAWFSVGVPGFGWVEVDPTNDQLRDQRYVTVGWGRDFSDVSPLKGVLFSGGSGQQLHVGVDVVRVTT
ncbi:MAG: transglutaminase family protein [Actinomycetota bacterium]|nr:transglutaminase family protein [Actinomycetota bacterium]